MRVLVLLRETSAADYDYDYDYDYEHEHEHEHEHESSASVMMGVECPVSAHPWRAGHVAIAEASRTRFSMLDVQWQMFDVPRRCAHSSLWKMEKYSRENLLAPPVLA